MTIIFAYVCGVMTPRSLIRNLLNQMTDRKSASYESTANESGPSLKRPAHYYNRISHLADLSSPRSQPIEDVNPLIVMAGDSITEECEWNELLNRQRARSVAVLNRGSVEIRLQDYWNDLKQQYCPSTQGNRTSPVCLVQSLQCNSLRQEGCFVQYGFDEGTTQCTRGLLVLFTNTLKKLQTLEHIGDQRTIFMR